MMALVVSIILSLFTVFAKMQFIMGKQGIGSKKQQNKS
jgi:hypothetical protein